MDLDPEIGLQRATERGELDRFETEQLDFFKRVRSIYHARAGERPERYLIVDSSGSIDTVRKRLIDQFNSWLETQSSDAV